MPALWRRCTSPLEYDRHILTATHYQDARGDQCDVCARTLDAIDLINPRCLISKEHKVTTKSSAHMYVKLDVLQPKTEAWVKRRWALGKWSPNAVINHEGEIVDARMRAGLRPSPVTRDLTWGVPVPTVEGEDDHGMKGKVLCECSYAYMSVTFDVNLLHRRMGK